MQREVEEDTRTEDEVAGYCVMARRSSERCKLWKQINKNIWDLDRREEVTMAKEIHTDQVSICLTWHEDLLVWKSSFIGHLTYSHAFHLTSQSRSRSPA